LWYMDKDKDFSHKDKDLWYKEQNQDKDLWYMDNDKDLP